MFGKCDKCGAELKGVDSTSFLGRRLCSSCQASELGDVHILSLHQMLDPFSLVIKEAETHRNSLLNLRPGISIDITGIANYVPSILETVPNPPAYLSSVLQDIGHIQQGLLGLAAMGPLTIPSIAETVAGANLKMTDAFSSLLSAAPSLKLSFPGIEQGWLKPLLMVDTFKIPESLSTMVSTVVGVSLAAESQFLAFDPSRIADVVGIAESLANSSLVSLNDMALSYRSLWSSLQADPANLFTASTLLVEQPARELYLAGSLARLVAMPEETMVEAQAEERRQIASWAPLREKVRTLGEPFVEAYEGAIEAFMGGNVDKQRHVCTSLRELTTHVIHKLAPDDDVSRWSTDHKYFQKEKPTRRARLLYICRNIDVGSFSDFVKSDVESTLKFLDLLQEGTHSLSSPFGEAQLGALVSRAESLVSFLIDTCQI